MSDIKTKKVIIPIGFVGDTKGVTGSLKTLKNQLQELSKVTTNKDPLKGFTQVDVQKAQEQLGKLQEITESTVKDIQGNINQLDLNKKLKEAGISIEELNNSLKKVGIESKVSLTPLTDSFELLPKTIQRSETAIDKFGKSLFNSLRYNLVNTFIDAIGNMGQDIFSYYEQVDENLNNIRVVTGKSQEEMEGFFQTAQKGAKALSSTTNDYLEASEIFYQQGLATSEVIARTEATVMAANISQQSVATTADQVTAVLNGFNISANNIISTLDKMAAVGAGTATDFEELATSIQKVASAASTSGFTLDETLAVLSTISSVTREAPESIGTSFNTIIGRLNDLTLGDEVSSGIQKAFDQAGSGLSILNEETGQLKSGMQIFDELALKWDELNKNQKAAIVTAMAGTRQANRLLALFNNWDMFETYKQMSEEANGALEAQNAIYEQSLEAYKNRSVVAAEELWSNLFDIDTIKEFYSWVEKITNKLANIGDSIGGIKGILPSIMSLSQGVFTKNISPVITQAARKYQLRQSYDTESERKVLKYQEDELKKITGINVKLLTQKEKLLYFTKEEADEYDRQLEATLKMADEYNTLSTFSPFYQYEENGKIKGPSLKEVKKYKDDFSLEEEKIFSQNTEYQKELNNLQKQINKKNFEKNNLKKEELSLLKEITKEEIKITAQDEKQAEEQRKKILNQRIELKKDEYYNQSIDTLYSNLSSSAMDESSIINQLLMKTSAFDGISLNIGKNKDHVVSLKDILLGNYDKRLKIDKQEIIQVFKSQYDAIESNIKNSEEQLNKKNGLFSKINIFTSSLTNEETAKKIGQISSGLYSIIPAATSALNAFQTFSSGVATSQEKLSTASSAIGSLISTIGTLTPILFASAPAWISLLGPIGAIASMTLPILINVLDIGVSKLEKLNKKVDEAVEKSKKYTQAINQQKTDLATVNAYYSKLAEKYQKQAFAYEDLSEEQQGWYDQTAEYISKYAPELVKYYDDTGKAVIDLSKEIDYLNDAYYQNLKQTQDVNLAKVESNYNDLLEQRIRTEQDLEEAFSKRAAAQDKLLKNPENETARKELAAYEEEISTLQSNLANFSSNFNELITNPLVTTAEAYGELNVAMQGSLKSLASYNNLLSSGITDLNKYQESISNLSIALSKTTVDAEGNQVKLLEEKFSNMSEINRESFFKYLTFYKEDTKEMIKALETFSEEDIVSGKYIGTDLYNKSKEQGSEKADEYKRTIDYLEELDGKNPFGGPAIYINSSPELKKMYEDAKQGLEEVTREAYLYTDALNDYSESLLDLTLTDEGWNQVVIAARDTVEEIKLLEEKSQDATQAYDRLGRQVAALKSTDESYYNQFLQLNAVKVKELQDSYGIDLTNYRTLREAEDALDEFYTNQQLLRKTLAEEGVEAANKLALKNKAVQYAEELKLTEWAEASKLLMTKEGLENEQVIEHLGELQKIDSEIDFIEKTIKNFEELNDEKLKLYKEDAKAYIDTQVATGQMDKKVHGQYLKDLESVTLNKEGSGGLIDRLEDLRTQRTEILDKIQNIATGDAFKDVLSDSNFVWDALAQGSDALANFSYNILELEDISSYLKDEELLKEITEGVENLTEALTELALDLDPLREYVEALEEINHQLSILEKNKEMSYGEQRLAYLEQEVKLNKQSLETEQSKLNKIKEVAAAKELEIRAELKEIGSDDIKINDFGGIENYNELLLSIAQSKGKEQSDKIKELFDEYEEYTLDKTREVEESILDLESGINDLFQEQIELSVELVLEGKDRDLGIFETLAKIEKTGEKINLTIDIDTSLKSLDRTFGAAEDLLGELGSNDIFKDILGGNSELDQQTQMDILTGQLENLQTMASDLISLLEEMDEAYEKGLSDALSLLDNMISKYDNVINQYEYLISLSEQLGNQDYTYTLDSYNKMADISRDNLKAYQETAQMIKESRDEFTEGTDEWLTANDKYLEAQAKVIEEEKNLAEILGRRYDITVTSGRQNLEKVLFGGITAEEAKEALDDINKSREKYLDTEEKIYRLSKLQRTIEKDSDSYSGNPQVQAKIKKFMQEELGYLSDKKKLTETDLELSEKQYAVLKARIELEEAYANKQYTQILQRNQDGTFGYMYVLQQNEDLDKAKQTYEDSINDLYQFAETQNKELQQEAIDIRNEFLQEYDTITTSLKNGTLTQEEAVKKLQAAYNTMYQDIEANQMAQNDMQDQMVSTKLIQILGVSEDVLDGIDNFNDKIVTTFDILAANGELGNMQSLFEQFGVDFGAVAGSSAGEQMSYLYNALGGAGSNAASQIQSAMIGMGNATSATLMGLLNETGDFGQLSSEIFDASILGSGEKLDEFLSAYTNGTITSTEMFKELFANGFDETELNWEILQGTLITDIDSFKTQFTDTVENVVSQVTAAYEQYHEVLETAMTNAIERTEELDEITGILNEELDETLGLLEKEIDALTKLIDNYQELRKEVVEALGEIEKMINAIANAIANVAAQLKEIQYLGVTPGNSDETGGNTGGDTPYTLTTDKNGNVTGLFVEGDDKQTRQNFEDQYTEWLTTGPKTEHQVDLSDLNKKNLAVAKKQKEIEEARKTKAANQAANPLDPFGWGIFHSGGLVDSDPSGLFAIVKKNEKVLTEEQARITDRIYDNLKGISRSMQPSQINNNATSTTNNTTTYHIDNVSFPNATSAQEIEEALRNLDQKAIQYTGRANRYLGRNR